jgi:hypothetical protein
MVGRNNRSVGVPVNSATYQGIDRTVTLQLGRAIPAGATFALRVIGTGPKGVADTQGNPLDGNTTAARLPNGSDFIQAFQQGQPTQAKPNGALALGLQRKGARNGHRPHPKPQIHRRPH